MKSKEVAISLVKDISKLASYAIEDGHTEIGQTTLDLITESLIEYLGTHTHSEKSIETVRDSLYQANLRIGDLEEEVRSFTNRNVGLCSEIADLKARLKKYEQRKPEDYKLPKIEWPSVGEERYCIVLRSVDKDRLLSCIKAVRNMSGWTLLESKNAVEFVRDGHGPVLIANYNHSQSAQNVIDMVLSNVNVGLACFEVY